MIIRFVLFICISLYSILSIASDEIRLWNRNYNNPYYFEAVTNILEHSKEKYGDYTLVRSIPLEQGRAFSDLTANKTIDLMIGGVTLEREELAQLVYVPLDRGLLGFRVCMTGEQAKDFSKVRTLDDLKQQDLIMGMGTHWPDKRIFESHGLKAVTSAKYENLFPMLKQNRFDCFSRSLIEVDQELIEHAGEGFKIDKDLLFIYPLADFLIVSKENKRLKQRLNYGLKKALEDNSFFKIFDEHYNDVFLNHEMYSRRLLFMENNDLSNKAIFAINQYGIASFIVK